MLGIEGPESKLFDIVIQLGAILAVCWVYRERFTRAAFGLTSDPISQRFVANVVIAFLPAAVAGVMAYRIIKEVLFSPWVVAVALIVGGILILIIERVRPRPQNPRCRPDEVAHRARDRLLPDPGDDPRRVARRRDDHGGDDAARRPGGGDPVLFFLAVPTMLGATVYDLYKNRAILTVEGGELIAIGFVVAFVCALFVVRTLVGFVSRHGFGVFAWYRIAIGSVALLLLVMSR